MRVKRGENNILILKGLLCNKNIDIYRIERLLSNLVMVLFILISNIILI